ncbi:MAG: DUF1320 domain-containing protein [Candidatus Abawacabacteria bacterium]|nr:DUF1320 domain-containing protein [Candidatus Abawacabacteria bacterium]
MYCTINDIINVIPECELIQLSNDDELATAVNEDVVNNAIEDAMSTINGYLMARYTLPLTEVPRLLRRYAVELAVINIHARRFTQNMPESITEREKFVIAELGKIQKGVVTLNIETLNDSVKVPDASSVAINKTEADRVFTKELLDRF